MKLIDADKLKLSLCRECSLYPNECLEKNGECDWNSIAHINMMTPVDAVQVIRCKDCKHVSIVECYAKHEKYVTFYICTRNNVGIDMNAEDFCSRAERAEE